MPTEEREPLAKAELSLKFASAPTGGIFNTGSADGTVEGKRKDFVTSFTSSGPPPVIPEAIAGSDWSSVLIAKEKPPGLLKALTFNCFFQHNFALTRAQWIWVVNVLFFAAHLTLGILVVEGAGHTADSNLVPVWRTRRNFTASAQLGYVVHLENNGWPVRLDLLVGAVFFVSALSHLFIVAAGPFDMYVRILWRQLDLCFSWWRWLELSISGPVLMFVLALICGLQEQVLLASLFMLTWSAFLCILITEMLSRPVAVESGKFDMQRYVGDREPREKDDVGDKIMVAAQHRSNYRFRTFPSQLAIFLGVAAWWILIQSWFQQLDDLKHSGVPDVYDRIPRWILWCVFVTLVFGVVGLLVHMRYQMLAPARRWEAELIQYVVGAVPKIVVGMLVWQNALTPDVTVAEALTLLNTTAVNISALAATV